MFENIIVTLDGSKNAEMVLPYAEEIAGKFNSSVNLVGVVEKKSEPALPLVSTGAENEFKSYFAEVIDRLKKEGKEFGISDSERITSNILYGDIASTILSYAEESRSGLIALTAQGASQHNKWSLGSVAAKILRAARRPVLLVRRNAPEAYLKENRLIRKILMPLDGSKLGETAIPYAETLAQQISAEIVLIHVAEPFDLGLFHDVPHYPQSVEDDLTKGMVQERAYLNSKAEAITAKTGVPAATAILKGKPAQEIAKYAEENNIDLIAISTHGRTGIANWVFGSVADKTLHFGKTAVLVVRPQKEK